LLRSDPERARSLLAEGLEHRPNDSGLVYTLGCLEAIEGDADAALRLLERAFAAQPALRRWSRDDDDLVSLRDDVRFQRLTAEP